MQRRGVLKSRHAVALVAVVMAGWLGYRLALPAWAEARVAAELAARGFPDAHFRLSSVSPSRLVVRDLALAPGLSVDELVVRYRLAGLLDGTVDELAITGARWVMSSGDESGNNLAARFVSRPRATGDRALPPIHLRDSMITVADHELPIDADLRPQVGAVAFEVRSRLGDLPVRIAGRHRGNGEPALEAVAQLGLPAAAIGAQMEARRHGDRLSLAVRARYQGAEGELGGHRVAAAEVTVDGSVTLAGWRIAAADLEARGLGVRIDGAAPADLTLTLDERAGGVAARLEASGAPGTGWLRGELGDDPRRWASAAVPVIWEVAGRVPHAARHRLRDAGIVVAEGAELTTTGTGTLELDRARERLALRDARLALAAPAVALPRWQLDVTDLEATLALSARLDRERISVELHPGSRLRAGRARRGSIHARTLRLEGAGRLTRDDGGLEVEATGPLALRARRIAREDVVIGGAHLSLPAGARRARATADLVSWRGEDLFTASGSVALDRGALTLEGRCATGDGVRGRLTGRVDSRGRGHLEVTVAPTIVDRGDRVHTAARNLAGIDVRGRVSGTLHLDLEGSERSSARISLRDAEVGRGGRTLGGVVSDLALTSLSPLRASVSASAFDLAGGRIRVEPFTVDPDHLDLGLDLELRGLSAGRVISLLSQGRAAATGRLDGTLAVRVLGGPRPRVILGDGALRARRPGRIRVRDSAAIEALLVRSTDSEYGTAVRERVVAAAEDFRYAHLTLHLRGRREQARIHIRGTGREVRQDLDLTLNVGGLQAIADQALRVWPRARVHLSPASSP
jgi:hypothetical protein